MTEFYVVKVTKNNSELMEILIAHNEMEARKQAVQKYMKLALSCTTQLAVVTKAVYEKKYN